MTLQHPPRLVLLALLLALDSHAQTAATDTIPAAEQDIAITPPRRALTEEEIEQERKQVQGIWDGIIKKGVEARTDPFDIPVTPPPRPSQPPGTPPPPPPPIVDETESIR